MNHVSIRFNKSRGLPGRGTSEHVWRVFVDGQEYLFKNFKLNAPSRSEMDATGQDWNIFCSGVFEIDKETSTAIVNPIKI